MIYFFYLMVFVVFIFLCTNLFLFLLQKIWNMKYNYYYCKFTTWSTTLTLERTCKFIPPPWFRGGGVEGGGWNQPLVFDMFQYFEAILPAVESLWSPLKDEVHFMGGGAAGGLWHHQQWSPSWPPSWILPRIRNQVKTTRNGDFFMLEIKKNT